MGLRPSYQDRKMTRCRDDSTSAGRTWPSRATPSAARDVLQPSRGKQRCRTRRSAESALRRRWPSRSKGASELARRNVGE
eukprot:14570723-Heterocapsa_arctica.AAC.1